MMRSFSNAIESLLSVQNALEYAMKQRNGSEYRETSSMFPAVNLFRSGNDYVLKAELPGVKKEDIDLEIKHKHVRIRGERKPDYSAPEVSVHRVEREYGNFDRTCELPFEIDRDNIDASYEDGILSVKMSQSEQDKPSKILIS